MLAVLEVNVAIDPRISLTPAPTVNVGQRFGQALQNVRGFDLLSQQREQAPFQNKLLELNTELTQAQQPANLLAAERASSGLSQALLDNEQIAKLDMDNAISFNNALSSGNQGMINRELERQEQVVTGLVQSKQLPESELLEIQQARQLAQTPEGLQQLKQGTDAFLQQASGQQQKSVSQREFDDKVAIVEADPKLKTAKAKAAAIDLGLLARQSSSATERIATSPALADAVASVEGKKATATEEAKLTAQKKFKPQITKAVKLAEKEAIERGDVLTDLSRMEAALPGLNDAVGQLRELATIATSTMGGKVFDFAAKELGFGSTKGATAKAKFIGIVNNQVLPLLKPTFGGSFSIQEGESLKATMGDPDASVEEKLVQLDAFIEQKQRDIKTKQAQLEQNNISELSDDELFK